MEAEQADCECALLGDLSVVGMGDCEGTDERVFAKIRRVVDHGGPQWWLYASRCTVCGQEWMIAQDERIHDNYYLRRLTPNEMEAIVKQGVWPPEFLKFEDVIKLGPDNNKAAHFFNVDDLTDTVKELLEARSDISAADVAYLFCLPNKRAARLMKRASEMSWAQLRPFD